VVTCIELPYGAPEPLILEIGEDALVADCRGPAGVAGVAAGELVLAAVDDTADGIALGAQVVPGDRVAIAVGGAVPQAEAVISAVCDRLLAAGIEPADLTVLAAPPLEVLGEPQTFRDFVLAGRPITPFVPASDAQTSYVAADASDRPIHLARPLVDADVAVSVGGWSWDAALGGESPTGELWPAFSRQACRQRLVRDLARRGRRAVADWRQSNGDAIWQLGMTASLRLVPGRRGTLAAASFGLPAVAARRARRAAGGWRPVLPRRAQLTVASLADPTGGLPAVLRAVAVASRTTSPGGTICVASRLAEAPGVIFARYREGAPLEGLVREALATGDQALIADAFRARFFARCLGDRRLVLLSDLDETTLEDLEIGHAATPEVVERLAHRAESVVVLHEADCMLPRVAEE
jgi:hypothetical protein